MNSLSLNSLSAITGTQVLIEKILYNLLTIRGTVSWDLAQGSLISLVGRNVTADALVQVRALLQSDLELIKLDMIRDYTADTLPDNQYYLNLYIDSITVDPMDKTSFLIDLKLVTKANQSTITLP